MAKVAKLSKDSFDCCILFIDNTEVAMYCLSNPLYMNFQFPPCCM